MICTDYSNTVLFFIAQVQSINICVSTTDRDQKKSITQQNLLIRSASVWLCYDIVLLAPTGGTFAYMHSQPELPALHRDPGPNAAAQSSCPGASTGAGTGNSGELLIECKDQAPPSLSSVNVCLR